MSLRQVFALVVAALIVIATDISPQAGGIFALQIGPPIAGGEAMGSLKAGKKAVFVVRHGCCDVPSVRITASAEGMVNGVRQSIPLRLIPVGAGEGVYAITQEWPNDGQWIVQLNGECASTRRSASALVPVSRSTFIRDRVETLYIAVKPGHVDAMLTALARLRS